jgi:signal transduction histidine kinase
MNKIMLLFLFTFFNVFGQTNDKAVSQTKKIHTILVFTKDKIYQNETAAIKTLDSIKPYIEKEKNDSLFGLYYRLRYNLYNNQLDKTAALKAISNSIYYYEKAKNHKGVVLSTMNKGNLFLFKGDTETALKNYLIALKLAENNNFVNEMGLLNKNIGVVFSNLEKNEEALKYANKALQLFIKVKNEKEIGACYINIGNCYFNEYDANNALKNYDKGIEYAIKLKDSTNLGVLYNNIGTIYVEDKKDTIKGVNYLLKSLVIKEKNNDSNDILFQYTNTASLLAKISKYDQAKTYLEKALIMAKKANNKIELAEIYKIYSIINKDKKDYKNALYYQEIYSKYKDSLLNEDNNKAVEELKTKYQTVEKEKLLLEKETKLKKQKAIIYSIAFLAFLVGIIAYLLLKQQKLKNKQQEQEFQLKSAIDKIESQNQLHEQRLSISRDLHDNIGAQLTFIISSVDNLKYGFKITDEKINNQLDKINNFTKSTIVELRDTIWAMNSDEITFEDIQTRLLNFIEKVEQSNESLQIDFDVEKALNSRKLNSLEGINVFRTIQEAINNALKYSGCSKIQIQVKSKNNSIQITIKDNGNGFDVENAKLGNGILNMQKRMEEINGTFSIESSNNGTEITLIINPK